MLRTKILEKLNNCFIPVHLHFNNHGKIFYSNELFFGTSLEVTYIHKNILNINRLVYKDTIDLCYHDYPVHPSNPELPIRFNFKD